MIVNVVIPTYKPDNSLKEIIRRLNIQTIRPQRILLVNTEPELENEIEYLKQDNVTIINIKRSQFDHGGTRDFAMKQLTGDYVIYMTQDAMPANRNMIEALVSPMEADHSIAVTYGRQLPSKDCGIIERYTREFNYPAEDKVVTEAQIKQLGIKAYFCSDVCAAYRVKYYELVGGFPGKTIFNEDMIYAAKALSLGYKKMYCSKAKVVHSHNYTVKQQFKRNFDLGVSHRQFSYIFKSELKTEDEGIRLVVDTAKYLVNNGYWYMTPKLIVHSGAKYLGYRMGKKYNRLPEMVVKLCTMNTSYWRYKE